MEILIIFVLIVIAVIAYYVQKSFKRLVEIETHLTNISDMLEDWWKVECYRERKEKLTSLEEPLTQEKIDEYRKKHNIGKIL